MKARQKRLLFIVFAIIGIGIAAAMALQALRSNIAYFFSPSQVIAQPLPANEIFRLGGLVVKGSLNRQTDGLTVLFEITDNAATIPVRYTGILPDLFKEGQGVVAKGQMRADGTFQANEVLAKHDASYMPPEVADTLKAAHVEGIVETVKQQQLNENPQP